MMKRCDHCGRPFLPHHQHYAFVSNGQAVVVHKHCKDKLFEKHLNRKNGVHLD